MREAKESRSEFEFQCEEVNWCAGEGRRFIPRDQPSLPIVNKLVPVDCEFIPIPAYYDDMPVFARIPITAITMTSLRSADELYPIENISSSEGEEEVEEEEDVEGAEEVEEEEEEGEEIWAEEDRWDFNEDPVSD